MPKREVVRMGNRWILYLPAEYNDLWQEIKNRKMKVRVYIEILKEVSN